MARRCFYSFHYAVDSWRAATVRQIGSIEGNQPVTDNQWEDITGSSNRDERIAQWIDSQLKGRSCTVVLVGSETSSRKWITHEIIQSWNQGLGVVGIRIHGLKDSTGCLSKMGPNPFDFIAHAPSKSLLSSRVRCYNPVGNTSQERYAWIAQHLSSCVEEAIQIRKTNG